MSGQNVLVVAPHPDDEVLGCGGVIKRLVAKGAKVHWLIITHMSEAQGFKPAQIQKREAEIEQVANFMGFASTHNLKLPVALLDELGLSYLLGKISAVVSEIQPDEIYLPFRSDVHSDHKMVFDACAPLTKSFRYPFIKSVRVYETLSETDFTIKPDAQVFRPNVFVDITDYMSDKVRAMCMYESEILPAPFPRSAESLRSLATLRGSVAGALYAEAFMSLKQVE